MAKDTTRDRPVAPVVLIILSAAMLVLGLIGEPEGIMEWIVTLLLPASFAAMGVEQLLRWRRGLEEDAPDPESYLFDETSADEKLIVFAFPYRRLEKARRWDLLVPAIPAAFFVGWSFILDHSEWIVVVVAVSFSLTALFIWSWSLFRLLMHREVEFNLETGKLETRFRCPGKSRVREYGLSDVSEIIVEGHDKREHFSAYWCVKLTLVDGQSIDFGNAGKKEIVTSLASRLTGLTGKPIREIPKEPE